MPAARTDQARGGLFYHAAFSEMRLASSKNAMTQPGGGDIGFHPDRGGNLTPTIGATGMKRHFNMLMQVGLIGFTAAGFLLTSLKLPQYGLIANLAGQVFWLYSSYRAWRAADQIGMFIVSVCITFILMFGVVNYWWAS